MHLWIASYPRSGNSFLRVVLRNRYGLPSTDREYAAPDEFRTVTGSHFLHPNYRGAADPAAVRAVKTHDLPGPDAHPAVYIVRDGRDALVSYAHFALAYSYHCPPDAVTPARVRDTIRNLILEERSPYGTWARNVLAWADRPGTVVARFEELVAEPARVTDRAVAALGLGLSVVSDEVPTFATLNAADPKFYRRGVCGEWAEVFTPELQDLFWTRNGAAMTRFGYPARPARSGAAA